MPTKGYDVFFTEPFERPGMACRVCGTTCESRRHVQGPTSIVDALNKVNKLHDVYVCPHSDEPWHVQALELAKAIDASPSPSVQEIMKKDLERLVAANQTKGDGQADVDQA